MTTATTTATTNGTRRATKLGSALGLTLLTSILAATPAFTSSNGRVAPPTAEPYGYSLEDMASATAPFTRSGNNPALYPDTPLQVLYVGEIDIDVVGSDVIATGTNQFSVAAGTAFYVPVFNVNDAPPVLGQFPTSPAQAASYLFDQSQYGARGFEVIVDGVSSPLGASYVVGPLPVTGEDTRIITLAAFVGPLSAGTHTVRIRGGIFGDLVDDTYGITSLSEDFTYTVVVS